LAVPLSGTRTVEPATPAVAVLVHTEDLIWVPSTTLPRNVQPAGVVAVATLFVVPTSTSWSPICTEAGTTTVADVVLASFPAAARNPTDAAGAVVTATLRVSLSVAPSSSVTVRVTS
jgi:hypothetical protein